MGVLDVQISVIVATYNGEKFIYDQLLSIKNQTLQPDEVLIFDDCSKDNTCELVSNFIIQNNLYNWVLKINERNIGWKHNFINALCEAHGEIIFLCDQDDIWMPDKIESMSNIMLSNPAIELLAGNSRNFYTPSKNNAKVPFYSLKQRKFYLEGIWNGTNFISKINLLMKNKKKDSGEIKRVIFDEGIFSMQRQGCVMAIRRNIIKKILPYWDPDCPHDTLLWFYAAANNSLYLYEKHVIEYRHHDFNTGFLDTIGCGINAKSEINKIDTAQKQIIKLKQILIEEPLIDKDFKLQVIEKIEKYNNMRIDFLAGKSIKTGIKLMKQMKYVGKRQIIFDWLLAFAT